MMTINTLYELARNSVEKFASKVAFSMYEGDDVTYAEVGRRTVSYTHLDVYKRQIRA